MGIKDLSSMLRRPGARDDSCSDLELCGVDCLGVDVFSWLHKLIQASAEIRDCLLVVPRISIKTFLFDYFDTAYRPFLEHSISIILVFDGIRNPLKRVTDTDRQVARDSARIDLQNLLLSDEPTKSADRNGLTKVACEITDDMVAAACEWALENEVACVGAPYEADYQLVALEKVGVTKGSICDDSDLFPLGANLMVQQYCPGLHGSKFSIVRRVEIKNKVFEGYTDDDIIAACIFLGCDYLSRCHGFGPDKVIKGQDSLMSLWIVSDVEQRAAILSSIEATGEWRANSRCRTRGIDNYATDFCRVFNFFKYAPVISTVDDTLKVISLQQLPANERLDDKLHFPYEQTALMGPATLIDYYCMKIWIRKGLAIKDMDLCQPLNALGELIPWGSILDFSVVPIIHQPVKLLKHWLSTRGVLNHDNIENSLVYAGVERHFSAGTPILVSEVETGMGHYITWDSVKARTTLTWLASNDVLRVARTHLQLGVLYGMMDVPSSLGLRSFGLLSNGHLALNSLCVTTECYYIGANSHEIDVIVFKINCAASLKNIIYCVRLVFNAQDSVLVEDASKCDCPKGQIRCSHKVALLCLLAGCLDNTELTFDSLLSMYPTSPLTLQSQCIPLVLLNYF